MSDYLEPVVVELEGRDRKLLDTLTRAKAEVRRFTAEVGRMNATIKVDVKLKDGALAEVRRRVAESPAAKLKVDLQLGAGQRDQLRAQLEGRPIRATVEPVMDQTALRRVQMVLQELGRRIDVQIRPDMDTAAQRRAQRRLDRMSQDRTVVIRTRVIGDQVPHGGGGREGRGGGAMGALMTLAPALTPIAAQAAVVAAQVGAAAVAVGAFGLAVKSQLSSLSGLSDAQAKVNEAVAKYGPASQQAGEAQQALSQILDTMPAQTQKAAAAFGILQKDFKSWSDSLAQFTMVPVTQGIGVLDALLPRLSPLVKDTSVQFTRLTTLLAGGISSGAFDGVMSKFTAFTNGALKEATDGLVHFARVLSQGGGNGAFSEFMTYAHENGPLVKDTLKNVAAAVMNIMHAASEAGPGMLTLVNAMAKLVAALPPGVVASLLQVSAAIKAIGLARSGIDAVSGPIGTLRTRLTGLITTARTAGGGLAGLRAAFASLSTGAKLGIAAAGVTALALALHELSDNKAPVAVDALSTSLNTLVATGKVTGTLKSNLDEMSASIAMMSKGASDNKFLKLTSDMGTWLGLATGPSISDATKNLDAWDQVMAQNVAAGRPQLAAAQFDILRRAWIAGGGDIKRLNKFTDGYHNALADQALEAKVAAESQGVFGAQALKVQAALDKQKAAVQGLQQAILDLNDTNRGALDAESAYQQAIDDATAAIRGHRDALHMSNGQLDLTSKAAREAYQPLSQLAAAAEESAKATLQQTGSQDKANRVLIDAHAQLVRVAKQMGLSSSEANTLANRLDNIKDPKIQVTVKKMQAEADLASFNSAVKRAPNAKSVTLKTLSSSAEQVLEAFGYKVKHLPDGSVKITAAAGGALAVISSVRGAIAALHDRHIVLTTEHRTIYTGKGGRGPNAATGGLLSRLPMRSFATGGEVQAFPQGGYVDGPGGPRSDSVTALLPSGPARVSNTEYVMQSSAVQKYGVGLMDALNAGHLKLAAYAKGGRVTKAEQQARNEARGDLTISRFGHMAGYKNDEFRSALAKPADISSLVNSLNQWASIIKKSTHGKQEQSLLKALDSSGKKLLSWEKQLGKVSASLEKAKNKLDDLKNSAAQLKASVASSIKGSVSVVTQAPQAGFALSSQDVVNSMSGQLSKALAFSNQLQELKKRGLSADLLEQIASAGVDQGGATAAALMGASDNQIKQLNNMQSQLKTSADKAGSAVADSMYGAGIKAAEGLVKGLEKKQKAIEDQMMKIAKAMEKSIKKALGINSPSTVTARIGDSTALGVAVGVTRSTKHAVIAARGLAMSVAQGAALTGAPSWAGLPGSGGRGGTVVHNYYHFKIEGNVRTIDGLARDIEKAFLQRGMRNPATYPQYKR